MTTPSSEQSRMTTYCMAPRAIGLGTEVPCQRERGHAGPHSYAVVWDDAADANAKSGPGGVR